MKNSKIINTLIPLMLVFILATWVQINTDFKTGSIYAVLIIGSIVMYTVLSINKVNYITQFKADVTIIVGLLASMVIGFIVLFEPQLAIAIPTPSMSLDGLQNFTYVVVLASVVEEFMFRGWILTMLRNFTSSPVAVIISSVLFSVYHAAVYGETQIMAFFGAVLFGCLASTVTIMTGNLSSSILMHSANNALQFIRSNNLLMIVS